RIDLALAEQLEALRLHEKSPSTFNHLQSLNAVAVTYQSLHDSRHARVYFDRALKIAERSGSPRVQDLIRGNLATTLIDDGEYARAARLLEEIVNRGVDSYPSVRYSELSSAYLKSGRSEAALTAAQQAFDRCAVERDAECITALDRRARAHAALGD